MYVYKITLHHCLRLCLIVWCQRVSDEGLWPAAAAWGCWQINASLSRCLHQSEETARGVVIYAADKFISAPNLKYLLDDADMPAPYNWQEVDVATDWSLINVWLRWSASPWLSAI